MNRTKDETFALLEIGISISEEKLHDDDLDDKSFTCRELEDRELPLIFSIRSSVEVLRISRTSFAMSAFILRSSSVLGSEFFGTYLNLKRQLEISYNYCESKFKF